MSGDFLLIYICNFHVLSDLLLIYICKFHWKFMEQVQHHLAPHGVFARGLYNHSPSFVWDVSFFVEAQGIAKALTDFIKSGNFLMIYIWNFHVLSHLLLIYICKLHWNLLLTISNQILILYIGIFLMIYIYKFHVLSHLLLIYICKLHWNSLVMERLNTVKLIGWSRNG